MGRLLREPGRFRVQRCKGEETQNPSVGFDKILTLVLAYHLTSIIMFRLILQRKKCCLREVTITGAITINAIQNHN